MPSPTPTPRPPEPAPAAPSPAHIALDGVRLETRWIPGDAARAPLVFLHEGLGSVAMWQQRGRDWPAEVCAATGRAGLLYSRRGYGLSDPIPDVRGPQGRHSARYMHTEAWEVLPRLLAECGVLPKGKEGFPGPVLIGHSDGATIALLHASRFPVSGCVAMAPHVMVEAVALQAIAQARDAYLRSHETRLRERLQRYHQDPDNAFWQWNDVWLSAAFATFDIRPQCAQVCAPLLLVQGLADEYGTLAQLDAIAAAAPQAQRLELADCGHSPHRDQPDALTRAVAEFCAALP